MNKEQLELPFTESVCQHPCRCGCGCQCEECPPGECLFSDTDSSELYDEDDLHDTDAEFEDLLQEFEQKDRDEDIKLALVHDDIRALILNTSEVLSTYERIDEDDENIFIPRPLIEHEVAEKLYNKLYTIHTLLGSIRKNRYNTLSV